MSGPRDDNSPQVPSPGYYRHVDGGFYLIFGDSGEHVDTHEQVVLYAHLWPFERKQWARNANDFKNFTLISFDEWDSEPKSDRLEAQARITSCKMARKALEAS